MNLTDDELKLCPLCGSHAQKVDMLVDDEISHRTGVACSNRKCPMRQPFYLHEWQSRPLEDALQRKLEVARNGITVARNLIEQVDNTGNYRQYVNLVKITLDNTLTDIEGK